MNIGQKIKKLRELRNSTQDYMASQMNISQRAYGNIEQNGNKVSYERISQIARILEVDAKDIVNFEEGMIFNNFIYTQKGNGFVINSQQRTKED